jgi:hypothetical protein
MEYSPISLEHYNITVEVVYITLNLLANIGDNSHVLTQQHLPIIEFIC